jgi:hypothetical protein
MRDTLYPVGKLLVDSGAVAHNFWRDYPSDELYVARGTELEKVRDPAEERARFVQRCLGIAQGGRPVILQVVGCRMIMTALRYGDRGCAATTEMMQVKRTET